MRNRETRKVQFRQGHEKEKFGEILVAERAASLQARTQCDYLAQHPQTIMKEAHLAPFGMVPAHWNFPDPQSGAVCQIKQLDIKSETVDVSGFDNWAANIEAECLETALRVPKW